MLLTEAHWHKNQMRAHMLCVTHGSHPVGIREGSQIIVQKNIQVPERFLQIEVQFTPISLSQTVLYSWI